MRSLWRVILNLPEFFLGITAVLIISLVFIEVIFRYFLQLPVGWSEEAAILLFLWGSFLGAAVSTKRKIHFSFLMIADRFSSKNKNRLSFIMQMIVIGTSLILAIQGIRVLEMASYERYIVLGVSKFWAYLSIPVGAALMFIYATSQLSQEIKATIRKKRERK
jgi:TRAP-type C4-dicarboxylate transport system permease small subunit